MGCHQSKQKGTTQQHKDRRRAKMRPENTSSDSGTRNLRKTVRRSGRIHRNGKKRYKPDSPSYSSFSMTDSKSEWASVSVETETSNNGCLKALY